MWADPDRQTGSIAEKNLKASHREIQECCTRERDTTADSLVEGVLAALPIYLDVFFLSQKTNMSRLI